MDERLFRIFDVDRSRTLIEATTCTELQKFMTSHYRIGKSKWEIEYLSPCRAIGWQPMTMIGFKREIRHETMARLRLVRS